MYTPRTYIHTYIHKHTHTMHMWNIIYTNMHKTYIQYSTYVHNTELAYTVTHKYRTMHWVHTISKPLTQIAVLNKGCPKHHAQVHMQIREVISTFKASSKECKMTSLSHEPAQPAW